MPDRLNTEQRHKNMAAIRGKNTKPEIMVRKFLWAHGYRYRLNHGRLPGKPDIVLRKYKACIFINGCFWHGHNITAEDIRMHINSECCKVPKTNREFWTHKILHNQQRDAEVQRQLAQMGWYSITVWECQLKPKEREQTLNTLIYTLNKIYLDDHNKRRFEPVEEPVPIAAEDTPQYTTH